MHFLGVAIAPENTFNVTSGINAYTQDNDLGINGGFSNKKKRCVIGREICYVAHKKMRN